MNVFRTFVSHVRRAGKRRLRAVETHALGRDRVFEAWDLGEDTFVFERGVTRSLDDHTSVLIVEKRDLGGRQRGRVMTLSTGNHAVAAIPLLSGRFWDLSSLAAGSASDVLARAVVCANIVDGRLELSQRSVSAPRVFAADEWLRGEAGFSLRDIVLGERTEETIEHYRARGEEWRVKPLAWSDAEIKTAIRASRRRIDSDLVYYHAMRGVNFLSLTGFRRLAELARNDFSAFTRALDELVGVYEGTSFVRMPKFRGHHEIEFFGLRRGAALERLVPDLERLHGQIADGAIGQLGAIQQIDEAVRLFESLLSRSELADETGTAFAETLYMHLTGEIYSVAGAGETPAFDDRRTALPGATFVDGRPVMQTGSDERTKVLITAIREMMSKGERIEYANVYEIRDDENRPVGEGPTRELVFKTNLRPLESSIIEKTLSSSQHGYGDYLLARIGALRALGVNMSVYYRLLPSAAAPGRRRPDRYIRFRCEGEPLDSIPAGYFGQSEDSAVEDPAVVAGLATLMGDAAAQNMAMKKYDPASRSPLYGVGKEIYLFEYDIIHERVVPKSVSTCSIRGSFGWPDTAQTEDNLVALADFYFTCYAEKLAAFARAHSVPLADLAERFFGGFEYRTHAMAWQLSVMRDRFEAFEPKTLARYDFAGRWRFLIWSLERQDRRLPLLRKLFFEKVKVCENEENRNHPQ